MQQFIQEYQHVVNSVWFLVQDPFNMGVNVGPWGTKDKPRLVPSMFDERIVGCICEFGWWCALIGVSLANQISELAITSLWVQSHNRLSERGHVFFTTNTILLQSHLLGRHSQKRPQNHFYSYSEWWKDLETKLVTCVCLSWLIASCKNVATKQKELMVPNEAMFSSSRLIKGCKLEYGSPGNAGQ